MASCPENGSIVVIFALFAPANELFTVAVINLTSSRKTRQMRMRRLR